MNATQRTYIQKSKRAVSPFSSSPFSAMASAVGLALLTFCVACGSASVSPKVVATKAASDFACKPEQVNVEKVTDNNWKAAGCGKETTYVCSGSSMMSDGMCMREGEIKGK